MTQASDKFDNRSLARPPASDRRGANPRGQGSNQEAADQVELLARFLDNLFEIPGLGIRFGLDVLIGLIPGVGDALTSAASLYILRTGARYGVPKVTLARMAANVALDYIVGSIPILGDAFDVFWKANVRNVALLRRHLAVTPVEEQKATRGDWIFVTLLGVGLIVLLIGCIAMASLILMALWRFAFPGRA